MRWSFPRKERDNPGPYHLEPRFRGEARRQPSALDRPASAHNALIAANIKLEVDPPVQ
jgi:hypothetical protein